VEQCITLRGKNEIIYDLSKSTLLSSKVGEKQVMLCGTLDIKK
jgi:hypothetical protein